MTESTPVMQAGCSPDPDDVFMFYGFEKGLVDTPFRIEPRYEDIQTLNRKALDGVYEISAISAYMYPFICHRYALLAAGASVGRGYGPVIVSNRRYDADDLRKLSVAIPGRFTTSYLLCRMFLPAFKEVEMSFEDVVPALTNREVDCALLIHEAQITYRELGLHRVVSLYDLWHGSTGLPLPLGLEAVRLEEADAWGRAINDALVLSIELAKRDFEAAMEHAISHRQTGLAPAQGRRYLEMYVNDDTLGMPADVRKALGLLYTTAHELGLIPEVPVLRIVE